MGHRRRRLAGRVAAPMSRHESPRRLLGWGHRLVQRHHVRTFPHRRAVACGSRFCPAGSVAGAILVSTGYGKNWNRYLRGRLLSVSVRLPVLRRRARMVHADNGAAGGDRVHHQLAAYCFLHGDRPVAPGVDRRYHWICKQARTSAQVPYAWLPGHRTLLCLPVARRLGGHCRRHQPVGRDISHPAHCRCRHRNSPAGRGCAGAGEAIAHAGDPCIVHGIYRAVPLRAPHHRAVHGRHNDAPVPAAGLPAE